MQKPCSSPLKRYFFNTRPRRWVDSSVVRARPLSRHGNPSQQHSSCSLKCSGESSDTSLLVHQGDSVCPWSMGRTQETYLSLHGVSTHWPKTLTQAAHRSLLPASLSKPLRTAAQHTAGGYLRERQCHTVFGNVQPCSIGSINGREGQRDRERERERGRRQELCECACVRACAAL